MIKSRDQVTWSSSSPNVKKKQLLPILILLINQVKIFFLITKKSSNSFKIGAKFQMIKSRDQALVQM